MIRFVAIFIFCTSLITGRAQVLENAERAFQLARQSQKAVLLIFSGSDWCQPCIRFHKTILSDSSFLRFAGRELVLLKADFPQRKKLAKEIIAQNESLAEQFNPAGEFPRLLLLKPDRSVLNVIAFNYQSPRIFIQQIHQNLDRAHMLKEYTTRARLMGSGFEFIVVAENDHSGQHLLQECITEVQRIEALLTEFRETSETALINRHAGIVPVTVSAETFRLIQRSIHISQLTGGAFDITASPLKKLYNFTGGQFAMPDRAIVRKTLQQTGYGKIQLTPPDQVFLPVTGMHISFAAIGKGYAADKVKQLLQHKGATGGVINASGDLTTWGTRTNGEPWKAGIAHPDDPDNMLLWLPLQNASIATSGNYIRYFDHKGIRYSHNIDPLTGYPVKATKSVSIIGPGAELSDALATAVTVMGVENGLHFVNQLPETHCVIVDDKNRVHCSRNISMPHAV